MERPYIHTVYHRVPGSADNIVFLHDSLGCCTLWRDFPEKLAQTAHADAFIYDRIGYGQSDPFNGSLRRVNYLETEADLLVDILEEHGIRDPVLFGHSDGGTIALLAAAKYPDKIKAVITEGAHVFVEDITLDGIVFTKEQYKTGGLKERLERYHGNKTQQLFDAWTETWLSDSFRSWNIESFLASVTCAVLVIQGTEDEYGTIAQVEAICSQVSGPAERCMIINAGHTPHKQSELWTIQTSAAFLEKYINEASLVKLKKRRFKNY